MVITNCKLGLKSQGGGLYRDRHSQKAHNQNEQFHTNYKKKKREEKHGKLAHLRPHCSLQSPNVHCYELST